MEGELDFDAVELFTMDCFAKSNTFFRCPGFTPIASKSFSVR
jgi:hypothetical protein